MPTKPKLNRSIAEIYGYTHKDFKKWGKLGGCSAKYVNDSERYKAYRRRKAQTKLLSGERTGLLNMTTGRINKKKKSLSVKEKISKAKSAEIVAVFK